MNILKKISELTFISTSELIRFSKSAPYRYKVYQIPKRNGKGERTIAHPSKELKLIQRLCVDQLKGVLIIHDSAKAYKKGVGIKDNALAHVNNRYLLKMDFKDFFPSVTPVLFFNICSQSNLTFDIENKRFLRHILFRKDRTENKFKLSIGAPSSPLISNFIMSRFDMKMQEYCLENNVSYTRYADDLAFSTNLKGFLFTLPNIVRNILSETTRNTISVNENKTVFTSTKHNRHVTGITLSNDGKLSVGREKKRDISAMVHHFKLGCLSEEKTSNLKGQLSFISDVEPQYLQILSKKYGDETISALIHGFTKL